MDWTEILKVTLPGIVGAGSAILSSVLTNRHAEKRHKRETILKEHELQQKLLETITPFRLNACREIYMVLEDLKRSPRVTQENLGKVVQDLLWLDQPYANKLINSLSELTAGKVLGNDAIYILSQLQEEIRKVSGAEALNRLYTVFMKNNKGP